jgi:hypothetical protein
MLVRAAQTTVWRRMFKINWYLHDRGLHIGSPLYFQQIREAFLRLCYDCIQCTLSHHSVSLSICAVEDAPLSEHNMKTSAVALWFWRHCNL